MSETRQVRLFRNGRNQAVRIPVEFERPGTTATMRRDGARLIIEPAWRKPSLKELLASWEPIDDEFLIWTTAFFQHVMAIFETLRHDARHQHRLPRPA